MYRRCLNVITSLKKRKLKNGCDCHWKVESHGLVWNVFIVEAEQIAAVQYHVRTESKLASVLMVDYVKIKTFVANLFFWSVW
jgi:hypothetical protein